MDAEAHRAKAARERIIKRLIEGLARLQEEGRIAEFVTDGSKESHLRLTDAGPGITLDLGEVQKHPLGSEVDSEPVG